MALKARLESLDELDESTRALYREDGDGFLLDVEGVDGYALENVAGLKKTTNSERAARQRLEKAMKAYQLEDGELLDAEAALEALEKVKTLSELDPTQDVDKRIADAVDSARKAILKEQGKKEAGWQEREATLRSALEGALIDVAIDQAITHGEVKGIPKALRPLMRPQIALRENDGKFDVFVRDPDSPDQPRLNGSGDPMSPLEYARELKSDPDLAGMFEGSGRTGGGANPPHRKGATPGKNLRGAARVADALPEFMRERGVGA